jgi:glycosyltransferase involved in cell wall biosynthesis
VRREHVNIFLIPATDWLRHPVPSRQHHIFEILAETCNVHVFQFDLYPQNPARETRVILHRLGGASIKGLFSYYISHMFSYSKEIIRIIKRENIDVVVVSNLLPGVPALLGNRLGCKVVFDLKDMFSDNSAIYYKNTIFSSMVKGASELLLQRLLKKADHVIAVSMFLVEYLKRIGIRNISLITNGADIGKFKANLQQEGNIASVKEDLEGKRVIGYVGTIDRWVDFETVLASLKELSTRMNGVTLLVVGGKMVTDYFDEVKSIVRRLGVQDNVIFTGMVPHVDVPNYINLMDVCLIPMKQGLRLNQARCPDKLFEYLACGKPVVSTPIPEVLRIGKGVVMFYNDVASLVNCIVNAITDKERRAYLEKIALSIARNYDWRLIAENYRKTLENVIAN